MFADPFLESRKTLLYLSGHVHSYQRFQADRKAFVVSGGGGGPRHRVQQGARRMPFEDAYAAGSLRRFHYLLITITDDGLDIETKMLDDDGDGCSVGDRFRLSFA
jgi:hypothetical protein